MKFYVGQISFIRPFSHGLWRGKSAEKEDDLDVASNHSKGEVMKLLYKISCSWPFCHNEGHFDAWFPEIRQFWKFSKPEISGRKFSDSNSISTFVHNICFLSICGTEKCHFGFRYVLLALFLVYARQCMVNIVWNNQASFPGFIFSHISL